MKRSLRALAVLSLVVLLGAATMYAWNPYTTASYDPRARILGFTFYSIASNAMAPALLRGDLILVITSSYRVSAPQRGDVIVFTYPPDPQQVYVKRVVGLPGDHVVIRDGALRIESPIADGSVTSEDWQAAQQTADDAASLIPPDAYYVLGDNRSASRDSRYWGFVPGANIVGRADNILYAENPARIGPIGEFVP